MTKEEMTPKSNLELAYNHIREQIESGIIRPGQLLSRRQIAQDVGVGSTAVQIALAQLEREGIVESRARSGTYVRELSEKEFLDLCDVREVVEPFAAELAAERIRPDQIKVLWESCQRYRRMREEAPRHRHTVDTWLLRCQVIREELIFHGTILEASGNDVLTKLVSTLRLISQVSPRMVYEGGQDHENSPEVIAMEHEGIVQAIEAGDASLARERMFNHIRGARILIQESWSDSKETHKKPVRLQS